VDGVAQEHGSGDAADALALRLSGARDPVMALTVLASVRHLHALVRELRPDPDDLRRALEFLTEVGQASDARRQEWVLLADVLGVSALVEDMAHPVPPGATPQTVAGPFYRADVPQTPQGADLCLDGRGETLSATVTVRALDGSAVAGAAVEAWQANGEGLYENQEPDLQPEFNLRGRFVTDQEGRVRFRSVRPGGYRLPSDGPVGQLFDRLGLAIERPAHLHFRVTAPGFQTLVTHVFDRDDPAIARDAIFGVKPGLVTEFRPGPSEGAPRWLVDVALVLVPQDGTQKLPTRGQARARPVREGN
jgi:protocatechuate 3,4-dioxygenase beta subunit